MSKRSTAVWDPRGSEFLTNWKKIEWNMSAFELVAPHMKDTVVVKAEHIYQASETPIPQRSVEKLSAIGTPGSKNLQCEPPAACRGTAHRGGFTLFGSAIKHWPNQLALVR